MTLMMGRTATKSVPSRTITIRATPYDFPMGEDEDVTRIRKLRMALDHYH